MAAGRQRIAKIALDAGRRPPPDIGVAVQRAGHRPLLLGFLGWLLVATTSLALQSITGTGLS